MLHPPRILVVEDDVSIAEAVRVALAEQGYVIEAVADGTAALAAARVFHPDLAVLDVRFPTPPDGLTVGRRLREASDIPILFLTAADAAFDRIAGFESGADDYVVKPFNMAELLARIRALLRRSGRLRSESWTVGDLVVDEDARTVTCAKTPLQLTAMEFEILSALGRYRGKVLSKSQLLTLVWGHDAYDPNLVEVHVSSLRRKIEAHGRRLIHTVRGFGYVLRE